MGNNELDFMRTLSETFKNILGSVIAPAAYSLSSKSVYRSRDSGYHDTIIAFVIYSVSVSSGL